MSATGDLLDSKNAKIADLERQLAEAQAELKQLRYFHDKAQALIDNQMWEIDRMRPVVEAALTKDFSAVIAAVSDYEAKEKPPMRDAELDSWGPSS